MMSACVHPTSNSVQVLRFPRASTDAAVTALFQLRGQLATPISISREAPCPAPVEFVERRILCHFQPIEDSVST